VIILHQGNDMTANERNKVIQHLRRIALRKDGAGLTDAQLLEEYRSHREEAALAALVRRHGPMVWGVCRRVLVNHHDAEDAFQATFLVFVRKAASIASPELLANWLYGVAHQTALKARATAAKRKTRERQVKEMPEPAVTENDLWNDLQPLLDQELSRLSDKYRSAIVLCDLEGKTRKEAARHLGVPEGTLAARLARGRKMLTQRLARHGVTLAGGALAVVLAQNAASATVPSEVVGAAIKAASLVAAGQAAGMCGISVQAVALMEGVLKTMFLSKLKIATAVVLGMGLLGAGWGLYPTRAAAPQAEQQETKQSTGETPVAPGKEGGDPAKEGPGEKKIRLPKGPAPVQVLANLDKDGKLVVKTEQMVAFKVRKAPLDVGLPPEAPHLGPHVFIKGIGEGVHPKGPIELSYDLEEVQVFDTKGKAIEKKELAKLLKDETVAVATFGDQPPDPLHLRILKEGTPVLVLPLPPPDKMSFPDAEQALFPEFGKATFRVLFIRKRSLDLESKEKQ
jgi:RNA polymerase sigma factor (sigma-70 family)